MFKLSLCLIYPLTPLGIASFSWTVPLFSRFMWRLHSYLISREQNKMRKKNTHIPNCAVFLLKNFLRCTLHNVYYLFRAFFLCAHRTQTYTCIHQQQVNRCGNRLFSNKSCIVIIPMERHNY